MRVCLCVLCSSANAIACTRKRIYIHIFITRKYIYICTFRRVNVFMCVVLVRRRYLVNTSTFVRAHTHTHTHAHTHTHIHTLFRNRVNKASIWDTFEWATSCM